MWKASSCNTALENNTIRTYWKAHLHCTFFELRSFLIMLYQRPSPIILGCLELLMKALPEKNNVWKISNLVLEFQRDNATVTLVWMISGRVSQLLSHQVIKQIIIHCSFFGLLPMKQWGKDVKKIIKLLLINNHVEKTTLTSFLLTTFSIIKKKQHNHCNSVERLPCKWLKLTKWQANTQIFNFLTAILLGFIQARQEELSKE